MKKLFLLDYKILDESVFSEQEDSILQTLKRYSLKIGDYEQNILTEAIFNRLGWSNKYKDTVFSFRTIVCNVFAVYSQVNEIRLDGGARVVFCFENNVLRYEINGKRANKYIYKKNVLYEKVTSSEQALAQVMNWICNDEEIRDNLNEVARLADSLSNFTPHPGFPFNQVKGRLEDVADSLNLMVDKIQGCIDNNEPLKYDRQEKPVDIEELKKWQEWFIANRSTYCLNGFYSVAEGKIKGIKLFRGQSLAKPFPENREEIKLYLENTIKLLEERGENMNKSIH